MPATTSVKFECSLAFRDAWRATSDEIDTLVQKMIGSFSAEGVTGLTFQGDIRDGSLDVRFDLPPLGDEDTLECMGIVVRALNAGYVEAPGWPTNEVIEHAIASVSVRECAFEVAA